MATWGASDTGVHTQQEEYQARAETEHRTELAHGLLTQFDHMQQCFNCSDQSIEQFDLLLPILCCNSKHSHQDYDTDMLCAYGMQFQGQTVLVGVDDMDLFKGIELKLMAVERVLDHHPEWRGKLVLIQVTMAPRSVNLAAMHSWWY